MSGRQESLWFTLGAVIWVGGWGLFMYRYPERIIALNKRHGWSPQEKFLRRMGVVEMSIAGLCVLNEVLALMFGWYR